jgi:hypothetical protein
MTTSGIVALMAIQDYEDYVKNLIAVAHDDAERLAKTPFLRFLGITDWIRKNPELFREFMRLIFAASLHVEEGRQVFVRIALGTSGATPNIPFVHPLELDVKGIVKLAPAVNLWERQLLVASNDQGQLKITGIVQEKVVDWKGAGGVNRHSLGRLSVEVLGAGSIKVLAPLRIEYNRGEIQQLTELSTIPCVQALLGESPNVVLPERVLTNVLRQMQQGRHGGTIVFVPTNTEEWKDWIDNHNNATASDFLASAVRLWLEQTPIRDHIIKLHDLASTTG